MTIRAIVTDIEGTTTSISFVADTLFPYARARIQAFILQHADEPAVAAEINAVRAEAGEPGASLERVGDILVSWIEQDLKITPLKSLQGMIWRSGYEDGSLKGHLYPEVAAVLVQWKEQGLQLNVYSSGSESAQKLLFGYSEAGDLTPLFDHFFDTRIGGKREPASYEHIKTTLGLPGEQILFLSDVVAELDAASAAGLVTLALDRECIGEGFGSHPHVTDFRQIDLSRLV
ncbi:acireductone synthase [Ketobacter sp.]|uniref:acireductone synthase n=1 Tax=Ketobacter sp. TaxID=2083498 RepID=UPI000F2D36F6|nr:acireductone synthase [Ketobacter sp.]RLT98619.1 MAG: acireductone synthase [Ketobacter sp.]